MYDQYVHFTHCLHILGYGLFLRSWWWLKCRMFSGWLFLGFQVNVLAKLDAILENQLEELLLLRNIAASTQSSGSGEGVEDLVSSKINSHQELLEFDEKLQDAEFKKKMVYSFNCGFFMLTISLCLQLHSFFSCFVGCMKLCAVFPTCVLSRDLMNSTAAHGTRWVQRKFCQSTWSLFSTFSFSLISSC